MPTNEELAAAGVLQKGDKIPLGDPGTLMYDWKAEDWNKMVYNDYMFNQNTRGFPLFKNSLPTAAQLQSNSNTLSTLSPEFKKWYETASNNYKNISTSLYKGVGYNGSTKAAKDKANNQIPLDVYKALLTDIETKNINNLDSVLLPRVAEVMTLSPQEEHDRILEQWKTTVVPELTKHKTDFVKEKVALEESMAKAMGSSYLMFSSAKDLQSGISSSTQFLNSQYNSYSDKLGKAMSTLVSSALGSLEGLLPQAPKLSPITNNTTMWYLQTGNKPAEVNVNLETGAWTNVKGETGNFNYLDPESKVAMNSGDAEFSKLHLEYQNRMYQRGRDEATINKHYENLRTYLRGTLSSTLMKAVTKLY